MTVRLWIDVEDLFEYAQRNPRPSGIQRMSFEICRALYERYGHTGLIQFVRHHGMRSDFGIVTWEEVAALFCDMTSGVRQQSVLSQQPTPRGRAAPFVKKFVLVLPSDLRVPVQDALALQLKAFRAWQTAGRSFMAALRRTAMAAARRIRSNVVRLASHQRTQLSRVRVVDQFAKMAGPSDILLALGASWTHPDYPGLLKLQRSRHGLHVAALIYDLIPLRCPEWFDPHYRESVAHWFRNIVPECRYLLAISQAVARDIELYAGRENIVLPPRVVPIPVGTGFDPLPSVLPKNGDGLPEPGTYVLFVSTIEIRKNHALLFRVWCRLLDEMPWDQVPTLVFAGRVGTLVGDLMQQVANTNYLGGKLIILDNIDDAELASLYQGCMFTVFPSLYEGWGLPVTESLAFGKPCLIANRTSLPEAGGSLARRFNPDNLDDAYQAIRRVIENPAELEEWAAKIRDSFKPVPWSATAEALLEALDLRRMLATETAQRCPGLEPAGEAFSAPRHHETVAIADRALGAD
ncbi:MAG TPA: glycosyltransferase family 1 protein [Acetobacteraceae bacterium]|nr:glycosyltransferase family 1 protein [Acetobacteraceae bacterium]